MPTFGKQSLARLETCHPDIQKVLRRAIINGPDFTILSGHRSPEEQQALYAQGRTKPGNKVTNIDGVTKLSMHNHSPSLAVDIAPYPIDWNDHARFIQLAWYVQGIADAMGVNLRWGGDWNGNGRTDDERFVDLPHFELVEK